VRPLPLVVAPDGCSLSPSGLAAQAARAEALRPAVLRAERPAGGLRVAFAPDFDRSAVAALVATERECCSFLAIDYDEDARVLELSSDDARGPEVLDELATFFQGPA
jgi:hypothetical protein